MRKEAVSPECSVGVCTVCNVMFLCRHTPFTPSPYFTYIHMYVHTYVCVHMYVRVYVCTCAWYTYICVYVYVRMYVHTHIGMHCL